MTRSLAFVCTFVACTTVVCSAPHAQVPKNDPRPYAAPPAKSVLVFSRPRKRQAEETDIRIVDQGGRCLGLLKNGWQVAAEVYPGTQMLLVVTGTAPPAVQLIRAKLTGGKTYVVELAARVNTKNPASIGVVRREDQPLETFPKAILEQSPFESDLRKCSEWVSWKRSRIEPKAELAKSKWDDAADGFREEHTIRRNDGWTAAEVYAP